MDFDTRRAIYFIIYGLPKRETFMDVKFNGKFVACYIFS
jgi:hypothetical protein